MKATFATGLIHYDAPPPAQLEPGDSPGTVSSVDALRDADAFRFGNVLSAWAEFEGSTPVGYGQDGGMVMGSTTVRFGPLDATFARGRAARAPGPTPRWATAT